ncbi:MAG: hypothetical protein JXR84_16570, partial [Anaerolineae bacterium]|nr:hypothetical protein [Anaerolineae bacterium]
MVWLASEYHPINFALMTRIRGAFAPSQFQQALDKLRHKYPPLSTRVVREPDNIYIVSDTTLKFPARVITRKNAESWIEEASAELAQAFDLFNHPPLRLVLLQDKDVSELLLVCPHVLADGLSIAYLARDFLIFLSDLDADVTPMLPVPPLSASIPEFPGKKMTVQRAKLKAGLFKLFMDHNTKHNATPTEIANRIQPKYHVHPWVLTT